MALTACEEHAYPSAAPREGTAAAPMGDEALAGAPAGYGAPSTRTPQYVPPQGPGAPYGPPPGDVAPPPGYGQNGYPPTGYPPGYGHNNAGGAPPEIVTMAPIPNPPEEPHRYVRHSGEPHYGWRHRPTHGVWVREYPVPAYPHRHHHHGVMHSVPLAEPRPARVHTPAPHKLAPAHPALAPSAQLTKPVGPDHLKHHHHADAIAPATAAAASGGLTNTASNATANSTDSGSEADRYQSLEKTLKDAFANGAQLQAPAHMEANQPADVTLTVPADFDQTVQSEAGKVGLATAMATVNLVGVLSGDGYTIVPADPQTLPLAQGQATVFHWKVTPTGAGRGALTAAVKATAAGDNHTLDLGSKSTGSGAATGRVVGIGLLALIALVLLGWAAQRRRPNLAKGATKPRTTHTNGTPGV